MHLRWTTTAARDLTRISDYVLKEKSSAAARRVALAIYERVDSLKQFSRAGRPGRKAQTRELIITGLPYLVVYRIHNDVVEIARILHGAQKWP